jgi:hypothetical protein
LYVDFGCLTVASDKKVVEGNVCAFFVPLHLNPTADELTKSGIINLHLLSTAKKIYVENLNIGAEAERNHFQSSINKFN